MRPEIDALRLLHARQSTEYGVLLIDRGGKIVWCNPTAARTFGYRPADLIGLALDRLFTPEDVQQGIPAYELHVAANSRDDMNNDRWMLRSDGSRFWATGSTTGLRDDAGDLVGFGKFVRNSSDLKEQIETLRNRAEELQRADGRKNLFLSTVSHELRNPLTPLANALQLIRAIRPADESLQYPIRLIERQVEFIRRLVDDLLDVTRISIGTVQLELEAIDLRDVVGRAIESTRSLILQRRHRLIPHFLDVPLIVNADSDRLEQVFVNLLTNAAKYTPEGGEIEIRASMGQTEAWVHFRDNGIGIPTETLPHIFELFTRGETAAEQAKEGLGIGLSLVKQLVELHGGSVQVRSEGRAKGSEFTVRLPLASPRETTGS